MASSGQTTLVHICNYVNHDRFSRIHVFESDIEWQLATVAQASCDNLAAVAEVAVLPLHSQGTCGI